MSMMRRQTKIPIVPSSQTHKETPMSAAVTSTAPKLPDTIAGQPGAAYSKKGGL